jgi:type IV pilus assembly protein PilB
MARKRKKIGEILVEWGTISERDVEQALGIAKGSGKRIGEALIEAGFCKQIDIAKALATQFDMEFIDLDSPGAADDIDIVQIPEEIVKKHLVLPMGQQGGRLRLVIHDPMDLELLDLLRFRLNSEIDTAIASKDAIKAYIDNATGGGGKASFFSDESLVTESVDVSMDTSVDTSVDIAAGEDAPIIRLTNRIIVEAVRSRASDIHLEPMTDRVMLRYRIDGVCHERDNLPKRMQARCWRV